MQYKEIHMGEYIKRRMHELGISTCYIAELLDIQEDKVWEVLGEPSLSTEELLKWSKLLGYDFFRIYSQHLILYSPTYSRSSGTRIEPGSPGFRKNIYSNEIIQFVLELIKTGIKTRQQVIEDYNIPKTTLYKWMTKYEEK